MPRHRKPKIKRREPRAWDAHFIATIPCPPSANHLTFNLPTGRGRASTAKYERWQRDAGFLLNSQVDGDLPARPWGVDIHAKIGYKRDIDNLVKPTIDLLKTCGIIDDDRHVEEGSFKRVHSGEDVLLDDNHLRVVVYSKALPDSDPDGLS